ncbi:FxLYD domain-containing protein [Methanoculleus formosensis]|uniref:FxLYD domain-containing protein n=1 Tax=Methanoculleus formosensis TaxID=2590886 RepID=UPI0021C0AF2C|nr:FxLYD domain-containing protein [Methanoculleus sp. Afa-1]
MAALITEVSDGWYRFNVVVRESASSPWKHLSGYQGGTNTIQNIEIISPNKIGHVDPNSLETVILPTATPTKTIEPGKLQILTHNLEYDIYGIVDVVGTAKNVGGKRISWGTVEVKFYDRDGNMVGNAVDYVQNLDPGETWKFKAMYVDMDGSIHSYKVGVGTVW